MKNFIAIVILSNFILTNTFSQSRILLNDKAYSKLSNHSISYPFSFIAMGDTRRGVPDANYNELSKDWIEIMNQIKTTNFPNDFKFIIILGDLMVDGTQIQYDQFYNYTNSFMNSTSIPVISVPGNHDFYDKGSYVRFKSYIGKYDDYFDILDWRFLYINNTFQYDKSNKYEITNAQKDWVNNTALSQSTNCPANVISFAHLPFFRIWGSPTMSFPNYRNYFDSLIAKDCRVHYAAHYHEYMRQYDCFTDFFNITTGGGGAEVTYHYEDNPNPLFTEKFHFLYVTVYADGSLKTEVYFKDVGHNTEASKGDFWVHGQNYINNLTISGSDAGIKNYFAKTSISVAGNGTTYKAYSGSNVKMVVDKGGYVNLQSGFEIKIGAAFEIDIQNFDCENLSK